MAYTPLLWTTCPKMWTIKDRLRFSTNAFITKIPPEFPSGSPHASAPEKSEIAPDENMSDNSMRCGALMKTRPPAPISRIMAALLANLALLLPMLAALGAVLLLTPSWLGTLILLPLVTIALIGIPAYLIVGAIHAAATAGRDLRRQMAAAEAFHRAIRAQHAPLGGTPAPPRRCRLGEAD